MSELANIQTEAKNEINATENLRALEDLRVKYLGKKGLITAQMSKIGSLPIEEKKSFGALVNTVRDEVSQLLETQKNAAGRSGNQFTLKLRNHRYHPPHAPSHHRQNPPDFASYGRD